jgi:hypothetical protein
MLTAPQLVAPGLALAKLAATAPLHVQVILLVMAKLAFMIY